MRAHTLAPGMCSNVERGLKQGLDAWGALRAVVPAKALCKGAQ